jgi:riboflavin-specific deaminase-like protein
MESYLQIIFNKSKYPYIFGHLAQTLDGYIATESGESRYISSIDNLEHLHMLRAISDVVLVGSNTVKFDNPKLTTRLVKGPNPMRVVIDKNDTIKNSCNLLKNKDRKGFKIVSDKLKPNDENIFLLPLKKDEFRITDIISLLKSLGNKIIFIEGGGNIISHFYRKKFLNRLHLCISPILIGRGINSFIIDKDVKINEAKIKKISYIKMGKDILCNIKLPS